MHIERRKSKGGRIKFYLSHSFREGQQVHKVRKYLGQDLETREIDRRKKVAEKLILEEIHRHSIIKDPLQVRLSDKEIERTKKLQTTIPLKISHLSEKDWLEFSEVFTFNTNAIEGSKLNFSEVRDILENDNWPDKSKEDIAEAYGVNEAISFIRKTDEHISLELMKKIHWIVFRNSSAFSGRFRKKGENVIVVDGGKNIVHEGASPERIKHLLKELVGWYEKNKSTHPALVLGAVVHNQFENIHPFRDGNGRVGRLLLNNILLKHGLPPINIGFGNRAEYYYSLLAYEKYRNLKPTIDLYMKEYRSLMRKLGK